MTPGRIHSTVVSSTTGTIFPTGVGMSRSLMPDIFETAASAFDFVNLMPGSIVFIYSLSSFIELFKPVSKVIPPTEIPRAISTYWTRGPSTKHSLAVTGRC